MVEPNRETYQTPWGMPEDTFWDIYEGADVRRLRWILDNRPNVHLREVLKTMPFRDQVILELTTMYKNGEENLDG